MKKMIVALFASVTLSVGAFAQETQPAPGAQRVETRTISPVVFSLQGDDTIDIIGLRLSAWGTCQNLTGLDLAICGEATNAYGLQLAIIRNKVIDTAGALQVALAMNEAGTLTGAQIAAYNEAIVAKGLQVGLINNSHDVRGFQVGLVNTTDMIYGYQIGLINVIKGSPIPFLPVINFMLSAD